MILEQQIEELKKIGLTLNNDITIDDLLYSWDRREYEQPPFELLLIMFGVETEREPVGRKFCDQAWQLDMECINETGDYVHIVEQLCRTAGMPALITKVEDFIDFKNSEAWLRYEIDGDSRSYTITVNNDWADPNTMASIMQDIVRDGKEFYAKDNGQSSTWFYLDKVTAIKINALTGNMLG